jgi:hypothetical protein
MCAKMNPYAKPNERKVGPQRPKISHLPEAIDARSKKERQADKQAVAAERRAIKKSARRHLKQEMLEELGGV